MGRFIITGDLWLAVSRMVVVAVQQVHLFNCVVVLIMFARSFSSGVSGDSARALVDGANFMRSALWLGSASWCYGCWHWCLLHVLGLRGSSFRM